jgi:hypothetical protein
MTELVAMNIFFTIMGIGAFVWSVALYFTLRIGKSPTNVDWGTQNEGVFGLISGETVCAATMDELLERIPKVLRRQSLGILNSVFQCEGISDKEFSVTRHGPLMCNLPTALYFSKVHFRLESQSPNQTRVKYVIDQSAVMIRLKRIAMLILFCIGMPIMIGVGLLIWFMVIPSQNLAIRGQVFQTLQICHALWPPFMFVGTAAMATRAPKQFIERVLMVASDPDLMGESAALIASGQQQVHSMRSVFRSQ